MFVIARGNETADHAVLIDQYYRLRKRIFRDELRWDVPVHGDHERDGYDDLTPAYLLWCSNDRKTLYGAIRLLPTTGPTLLHDVFHRTHGPDPALIAPDIWEVTRMCIDAAKIKADFDGLTPSRAIGLLLLALCECGLVHGITRMVSNFEACVRRTYQRAGLVPRMHGSADGYGRKQVYCASFDITEELRLRIRAAVGIDLPLYQNTNDASLLPAADAIAA